MAAKQLAARSGQLNLEPALYHPERGGSALCVRPTSGSEHKPCPTCFFQACGRLPERCGKPQGRNLLAAYVAKGARLQGCKLLQGASPHL